MANKNLLTFYARNTQVQLTTYSPAVAFPGTDVPLSTIFGCLSKVDPWTNESDPETPTQDQRYIKKVFANMFVAKQITTNNISPVLPRIDWTEGVVYDYYLDNLDMFAENVNGGPLLKFYVKNKYDQVFKCLWNNNGQPSTSQPFFQPGYFTGNNIFVGEDGYKWKFMYTIDVGSKRNFMDSDWMPVPINPGATPNPVSTPAGYGDIEVINVVNGGSGYDPANAAVTITVTGDGIGCTAVPVIVDGAITDVIVTNPGTNYLNFDISVSSDIGSGANLTSTISPIGGHGFDPVSELNCVHVMLVAEFSGDEGGAIPTDIDYHQVSILISPFSVSSFPNPATGTIYKTSTDLIVASGFGTFEADEIVYEGTSLETATFKATVLSFDSVKNIVHVINTTGTPTLNATLVGNNTKTTRTILNVNTPDWIPYSGYLSAIQNRTGIQRSPDGKEQFKFVLGF